MIRLVVLLLGAEATRRKWRSMAIVGVLWLAIGIVIIGDGADGITVIATQTFAYFLIAEGVIALLLTMASPGYRSRFFFSRAMALLLLGLLIVESPWRNHLANSILFGTAFLIDGGIRAAASIVLRFSRWRLMLAGACLELVLAVFAFSSIPVTYEKTVPLCVGVAICLTGFTILRLALQLRGLPVDVAVTTLPLFARQHWFARSTPTHYLPGQPEDPRSHKHLTVRAWTPEGLEEGAHPRPLVGRYIATVDHRGVISTGHAVLELSPDIYVSHYPVEEIDHVPAPIARILRSTAENDTKGCFWASYEVEVTSRGEADERVKFHRFNAAQLRSFWNSYRRDETYNLTNRNCAVAVALALDAALEGSLGGRGMWLSFLRLLATPDVWLAAILRARAESMTWTPGLVLDYARAMRRVVEPRKMSWRERLLRMLRHLRLYRRTGRIGEAVSAVPRATAS